MTVTDQIKILNRKIKQNESQYDLDREAAKISALSSNNLDKYELLTGEDLDLKPSTIEQAKFEYSPLGKIFNKGLSEDDKKEGLLKRLKNIEDKNEKPLEVKNKANENIKEVTDFVDQPLSFEAKELIEEIKAIQKDVDYRKLKIKGGNNVDYDFSDYKTFKELFRYLYYKETTIDDVERKQDEFSAAIADLKNYAPRDNKYVEAKNKLLNNAKNFYEGREKIIEGFKNRVFPLYYSEIYEQMEAAAAAAAAAKEEKEEKRRKKKNKKKKQGKNPFNPEEVIEWMINREKLPINNELFKKHFKLERPVFLYKVLYETNNDKEKNSKLVNIFNSGLEDLEKEIKEMSKEEIEIEKPYNIVKVVKKILEINKINQQGKGLKILTPNQMLSRLPITLAQLKAGNNSEKLKNEIRQLLYSLYRSKNMTKQVYNNLINYI